MNHLKLAHLIWSSHLKPGMTAIDATMGNGQDTLFIAQIALTEDSGRIIAFDIQEKAISQTRSRLSENLPDALCKRISLIQSSHEEFPSGLGYVDLIVYNLGYLPGGDKSITTLADSTLKSLHNALNLLAQGGLLSIMLYPAHNEGASESSAVLEWIQTLRADKWSITHHYNVLRACSPSLVTIQPNP